jgi:hypothetical protein
MNIEAGPAGRAPRLEVNRRQVSTQDDWKRLLAWFKTHGVV